MILDRQAALERIEFDRELYDEICDIFREDAPKIMGQLLAAYESADIAAATRHAHSLKSAAANIGATELTETARVAENALRTGDFEKTSTLFQALNLDLSRVLETLA